MSGDELPELATETELTTELDDAAYQIFEAWRDAAAAAKQWTDRKDELGDYLKSILPKDSRRAVGTVRGKAVVRVTRYERQRFSTDRFKAAMPDLYNDFLVPTAVETLAAVK